MHFGDQVGSKALERGEKCGCLDFEENEKTVFVSFSLKQDCVPL